SELRESTPQPVDGTANGCRLQPQGCCTAPGSEIVDGPVVVAGMPAQLGVGVDHHGVTHHSEQRDVIGGVAVSPAVVQVQAFLVSYELDSDGLGRPVQDVTHKLAGIHSVMDLAHGSQGARQAQPCGNESDNLNWGCRPQPDPPADTEVLLGERLGSRPDPGLDHFV